MATGVVLCTYGEPTRNSFADQWMYSYRILKGLTRRIAPIPSAVLPLIATIRARQRVSTWRAHDFVSPLEPLTDQTVAALQAALAERGHGAEVAVVRAYEFRRPLLHEVLAGLRDRGCGRFVIVPAYVGGGDFTIGMTQVAVDDALAKLGWLAREHLAWCELSPDDAARDALAEVMADHVLEQAHARGLDLPAADWAVLLAAHGTVQTSPPGVDNGLISFGEVGWRIYKRLRDHFGLVRLGWLNHTKGGRWTEPAAPLAMRRLRDLGYRNLLYFPWGFTTDNAESALEGRVFAAELRSPFARVEHLSCVNVNPAFIRFLADRVNACLPVLQPA